LDVERFLRFWIEILFRLILFPTCFQRWDRIGDRLLGCSDHILNLSPIYEHRKYTIYLRCMSGTCLMGGSSCKTLGLPLLDNLFISIIEFYLNRFRIKSLQFLLIWWLYGKNNELAPFSDSCRNKSVIKLMFSYP